MKLALILLLCCILAGSQTQPTAVFIADHPRQCPHCPPHQGSPQQIDTLRKSCQDVRITSVIGEADFLIVWDSKTWQETSWGGHQQEYVIYNQAGDVVATGATHKISNAAKEICKLVAKEAAKAPKEGN